MIWILTRDMRETLIMTSPDQEKLLRKAKALAKRTQGASENPIRNKSLLERARKLFNTQALQATRAYETADVVWNSRLNPVGPVVRGYWNVCKFVFNKVSFDEGGEYNKNRGAAAAIAMVLATGPIAYQGASLVYHTPSFLGRLGYDGIASGLSYEDTGIFGKPAVIDGESELWSVGECKKFPCKAQKDSIEFRIRDRLWLDMQAFFSRFDLHDPGQLAMVLSSEQNACTHTAYGTRKRAIGWYPYMLDATCVPVTNGNYKRMLTLMRKLREAPEKAKPEIEQEINEALTQEL